MSHVRHVKHDKRPMFADFFMCPAFLIQDRHGCQGSPPLKRSSRAGFQNYSNQCPFVAPKTNLFGTLVVLVVNRDSVCTKPSLYSHCGIPQSSYKTSFRFLVSMCFPLEPLHLAAWFQAIVFQFVFFCPAPEFPPK